MSLSPRFSAAPDTDMVTPMALVYPILYQTTSLRTNSSLDLLSQSVETNSSLGSLVVSLSLHDDEDLPADLPNLLARRNLKHFHAHGSFPGSLEPRRRIGKMEDDAGAGRPKLRSLSMDCGVEGNDEEILQLADDGGVYESGAELWFDLDELE